MDEHIEAVAYITMWDGTVIQALRADGSFDETATAQAAADYLATNPVPEPPEPAEE